MFNNSGNILFLTTTIGTKWIFYQQYLIKKFFPEAKHVLIDGNMGWDFDKGMDCVWYDFIKVALAHQSTHTYFIHIDEDCFITGPDGILEYIKRIEYGEADLIGPADVIPPIRTENPKALNSFFMIGKIRSLAAVVSEYEIDLTFRSLGMELSPSIEEYKIEYEPYYDFFWNYYKQGYKIEFIQTGFHEEFKCTTLLDARQNTFALHMWFTRNWYSRSSLIYGVSNYTRYKTVGLYLKNKFSFSSITLLRSMDQWADYFQILYSRTVKKNIYRIRTRLM